MNRITRAAAAGTAAVALTLLGSGVASADEPSVWALPGVDTGALLGPAVHVPDALSPVAGVLTALGG
jgi:hypothetical protein